jgi:hypothetical protein
MKFWDIKVAFSYGFIKAKFEAFFKKKNIYLLIFSKNREVLIEYSFKYIFLQLKKTCQKNKSLTVVWQCS